MRRRPKPEAAAAAAEADERTVRTAAYALLAGRDFSRHELTERLLRKGYGAGVVAEAVARPRRGRPAARRALRRAVRHAARGRGHGPVRIRMDLRERGVDGRTIEQALDRPRSDWVRTAREARRRKFGVSPPGDYHERAKQARFLQYRGFSSDQIRAALGPGEDDLDYDH